LDTIKKEDTSIPSSNPISKRYIKGWLELHVYVLTQDASEYCALLYATNLTEQLVLDFTRNMDVASMDREHSKLGSRNQVEMPLFVNDVQLIDARK